MWSRWTTSVSILFLIPQNVFYTIIAAWTTCPSPYVWLCCSGFFLGFFFWSVGVYGCTKGLPMFSSRELLCTPGIQIRDFAPTSKGKKKRQTARPCTELSNSWLLRQSCRCKKARIKLDTLRTDEGERGRDETDKHSLRGRGDRLSPCLITVTAAKKTPQEQLTNQC